MPKPVFSCDISQGSDTRTESQAFHPVPQASNLVLHLPESRKTSPQKNRLLLQNRYIQVPYPDNTPVKQDIQGGKAGDIPAFMRWRFVCSKHPIFSTADKGTAKP
jgi:hypothetical protein